MVVLGVDGSTSCSGYSIFQDGKLVSYGAIKPKGHEWDNRLMQEWGQFCNIVEQYKPEILYYEQPPLKDGKITLLKLGAVQGLILALCAQYNIQVKFLSPADWRREVGLYDGTREGTKRDELKKKSIEKANQLFGLDLAWVAPKSSKNEDDVADAIMIAYSQVKPRYFGKLKE